MPFSLDDHLVVGISSSALFDTRCEHEIYVSEGLSPYVKHQIENEEIPFRPGPAYPLIKAMLQLNEVEGTRRVEVVVMSQNEPEAGLRIMNSIEALGLPMSRACFTGGVPVSRYLSSYNVSLFLSKDKEDVKTALKAGCASGFIYDSPEDLDVYSDHLRIAFDGDAVIFSDESERIYKEHGIEAFFENEKRNARKPMPEGPFSTLLKLLSEIQSVAEKSELRPVRTAIVTARNSPADKRVIYTLRAYGVKVNELFFMGGLPKEQVLRSFKPHIFFDDQTVYTEPASTRVPSALVPVEYERRAYRQTVASNGRGVSKDKFRSGCREILKCYVPMGKSRLPSDFTDFINKNSARSPSERANILNKLEAYNLKDLGLQDVTLNREGTASVIKRLNGIVA